MREIELFRNRGRPREEPLEMGTLDYESSDETSGQWRSDGHNDNGTDGQEDSGANVEEDRDNDNEVNSKR